MCSIDCMSFLNSREIDRKWHFCTLNTKTNLKPDHHLRLSEDDEAGKYGHLNELRAIDNLKSLDCAEARPVSDIQELTMMIVGREVVLW